MDSATGRLVNLDELDIIDAQAECAAWQTGLLNEPPRFIPVEGDKVFIVKRRRKIKKGRRSYKDFCR